MERERLEALHRKASEHYLRGEFAEALAAWRQVLELDPADEQALEGVRLSASLAESAPASPPDPTGGATADPVEPLDLGDLAAADEEVRRRVDELLGEARSHAVAGRRDEALALLETVRLLDEDNPQVEGIEKELGPATGRPESGGAPDEQVELWLTEAVQALEHGRPDEAQDLLEKVLEVRPGHLEAVHYLERLARASSEPSPEREDAPPAGLAPGRVEDTVPLGAPAPSLAAEAAVAGSRPRRENARAAAGLPGPGPVAPDLPAPAPRARSWLLLAVAVVAGIALASPWLVRKAFGSRAAAASAVRPQQESPARAASVEGTAAAGVSSRGTNPGEKPRELTPAERRARLEQETARAKAAEAAGDYASAILAWNAVLDLDPGNAAAIAELRRTGELYRKRKAEQEQLDQIRFAFEDGDYVAALKAIYRLPASMGTGRIERWKANGWYNLAVVSLRAGDCREALSHLGELEGVRPGDPGAKNLRGLAQQCLEAPQDRAYFDRVERLGFRRLDD